MRLIDADDLDILEYLEEFPTSENDRAWNDAVRAIAEYVRLAPTIERPTRSQFKRMAAQLGYEAVVRCQNCARWQRHTQVNRDYGQCQKHSCTMKYDDFCSRPERRTDEQ